MFRKILAVTFLVMVAGCEESDRPPTSGRPPITVGPNRIPRPPIGDPGFWDEVKEKREKEEQALKEYKEALSQARAIARAGKMDEADQMLLAAIDDLPGFFYCTEGVNMVSRFGTLRMYPEEREKYLLLP